MANQIKGSNNFDIGFYTDLMSNWKGFQETVQDQLTNMLRDQQRFFGAFSTRWLERSSNIGKHFSEMSSSGTKEYKELYNIWKNYQNKINARIIKVTNIQNNGYSELFESWETSRNEFMTILSKLRDMEDRENEAKSKTDLYSSWLNVMNNVSNQISAAMTQGNTEYQRLTKTWFEFLDNMKGVISTIPKSDSNYGDIMKTWEKISLEMGSEISNLISEGNNKLKKIQESWQNATNQINKDLSKVFKEINYEELYSGFFDRSALPVFAHGAASAKTAKKMEDELKRLRSKIEELEAQIDELRK
jgi:hypothetical protein